MNTKEEKTVEQKIQEWKEKYGDVYRVDVDGHTAFLKKPSRKALGAAWHFWRSLAIAWGCYGGRGKNTIIFCTW